MKEKLKELLHRRKRSSEPSSPRTSYEQSEPNSPRSPRTALHSASHANESHQAGRSRPLSSGLGDGRASHDAGRVSRSTAPETSSAKHTHPNPTELPESAAEDYRSYLPVLSPVDDANDGKGLGNQRVRDGDGLYEENVADRNMDRYRSSLDASRSKPLPEVPAPLNTGHNGRHVQPNSTGHVDSTIRAVPSETSHGKYRESGIADRTRPRQDMAVDPYTNDAQQDQRIIGSGKDWKQKQESMLKGVVDLNNTVDSDRDVQVAPTVTHEIIKPHKHEIVQRKLYREIHNYTHYHRLQPVLQTEVLPPRHFIPNPNGEGLIEVSAEELPARTGENRWWEIVQKEPQYPDSVHQWRTEPEVIESKTYIEDNGFEHRETTIIYPPKLADLSGYSGMVQPVHFDHKTGKRWLGALTTMDKLKQEINAVSEGDFMTMKEVTADLHEVPSSPTVKRKPVDSEFV